MRRLVERADPVRPVGELRVDRPLPVLTADGADATDGAVAAPVDRLAAFAFRGAGDVAGDAGAIPHRLQYPSSIVPAHPGCAQ